MFLMMGFQTMSSIQKMLYLLVHFNRKAMIVVSTVAALMAASIRLAAHIYRYDGVLLSFIPGPVNAGVRIAICSGSSINRPLLIVMIEASLYSNENDGKSIRMACV